MDPVKEVTTQLAKVQIQPTWYRPTCSCLACQMYRAENNLVTSEKTKETILPTNGLPSSNKRRSEIRDLFGGKR